MSVIEELAREFGRLPGVGPKTAQRLVYHLLKGSSDDGRRLYYRSGRRIMVVDVERAPLLSVSSPRPPEIVCTSEVQIKAKVVLTTASLGPV